MDTPLSSQSRQWRVRVTVRGDLVSAPFDLADEIRDAFGDPAEDEEGGAGAAGVEEVEQPLCVRDDARLTVRPVGHSDARIAGAEPVFEIDRECVEHWLARGCRARRRASSY